MEEEKGKMEEERRKKHTTIIISTTNTTITKTYEGNNVCVRTLSMKRSIGRRRKEGKVGEARGGGEGGREGNTKSVIGWISK